MRVMINESLCTGHGRCYAVAPQVFDPDDRGHGVVIVDPVPVDLEAQARAGVANCPERAIRIED